jgi:opacity protein-like surface antigen
MKRFALAVLMVLLLATMANAASVTLAWDASTSSGTTGYKVYVSQISGVYGPPSSAIALGNVLTHTVTGLAENTRYYFVATAMRGTLESAFSNQVDTTTPWGPLVPPNLKPVVSTVAQLKQMQLDLALVKKDVPLTVKQGTLMETAIKQIKYATNNLMTLLKPYPTQAGLRVTSSS